MDYMKAIYEDALAAAMEIGKTSKDMVFGEGDMGARIMLVGEAPGSEETKLSRPFVGKAGKNLDVFIDVLKLDRCDIYITNVVKYRPYKVSEKGRLSNRPPRQNEINLMLPFLLREIEAVKPDIVVTLGNVALRATSGKKDVTIGQLHAKRIETKALLHSFSLFALYHPASIIYNRALEKVYHDDLQLLKSYLESLS